MYRQIGGWLLAAILAAGLGAPSGVSAPAGQPVVKQATLQVKLSVKGMTCSACEVQIKKAAMTLAGVKTCDVSYKRNEAVVTYDPSRVKIEQVIAKLKKAGFKAAVKKA